MKISDLRFTERKWDFVKPFHIANNVSSSKVNIEVELVLADGTIGLGEASSSFRVNGESNESIFQLSSEMLEAIKGLDVRDYRRVFKKLDAYSRSAPSLKAAVQFATLHAFSRLISTPVYQILGGMKDFVETDKTVSIGSLEETVNDAREIFNAGHKVIKMKVGEDLQSDIARVLAVNDEIKGVKYIIDANNRLHAERSSAIHRRDVQEQCSGRLYSNNQYRPRTSMDSKSSDRARCTRSAPMKARERSSM
jgi:L-alanine-DL-glutamate epimerase-like enolase superfamily enzyme